METGAGLGHSRRRRAEGGSVEVIPAVDVLDGTVVRLARGDYDAVTDYGDDAARRVAMWGSEGAALVHVVDLTGARTGNPDPALWESVAAAGVPFQVGGGIRHADHAVAAVGAGAARVVLGTAAVWQPAVVDETVAAVGADRLVAAVDVRAGRAQGAGWRDAGRPVGDVVERLAGQGVRRVLVTGIESDGMMTGPALDLLELVRQAAPGLALIGSGGVGTLDDLRALVATGIEAAIVGRALYEGRFGYREAVEAAR